MPTKKSKSFGPQHTCRFVKPVEKELTNYAKFHAISFVEAVRHAVNAWSKGRDEK